jgi:hypothetical protein
MANSYTTQIIKDTTEHVVIKLTATFDGTGQEDNPNRINVSTLSGALNANAVPGLLSSGGSELSYYGVTLHRLWYDTTNGTTGDVELYWNANPVVTLMMLSGNSEYDGAGNWVTIPNAAKGTNSCNGDIGIRTRGMVANTSYTIVMELRKENEYFQRGQLTEPGAFNYGSDYGLRP